MKILWEDSIKGLTEVQEDDIRRAAQSCRCSLMQITTVNGILLSLQYVVLLYVKG